MVDADYLMKLIVNGTSDPGLEDFRSLLALRIADRRANPETDAPEGLNRFWFHASDEARFVRAESGVLIRSLAVQPSTGHETAIHQQPQLRASVSGS